MRKLIQQRYVLRDNMFAIICACLSIYFAYHLIAGERSYLRLTALQAEIEDTQDQYDLAYADRTALEQKVVMMRPGTVDPDLLEEQARKVLGFRRVDETIILMR